MTTSPVVTITEEIVAELEKLASKATPGPWIIDNSRVEGSINNAARTRHIAMTSLFQSVRGDDEENWANAGLIAAANPAVILALLAERAAMQSQIKAGILTQDNLELYLKDALRYQWLRNRHNALGDYLCVTDGEDGVIIEDVVGVDGLDLDAAIDQAMQEQKP